MTDKQAGPRLETGYEIADDILRNPDTDPRWVSPEIRILATEFERQQELLQRALEYVDTSPDLYRPGGDELKAEIKAHLSSN